MPRHTASRLLWWGLAALSLAGAGLLACSLYVERRYADRIRSSDRVPDEPVALVFGAGLAPNSIPSPLLRQRIDAAIGLYRSGKVKKLLVSGDNAERYHDETHAMKRNAMEQHLPESAIVGDFAGFSTYDSCFRAKAIFGVTRAVLVTQGFHLPRALYIANSLGIDAYGVAADEGRPRPASYWLRETLSRAHALLAVALRADPKQLGDRQPIDPEK